MSFFHGFVRVAAASPVLRVADCGYNGGQILASMRRAEAESASLLVLPELCITGYTCADLFQQTVLQREAVAGLLEIAKASTSSYRGILLVGLPISVDDQLFNCAAVIHAGKILGVVPKSFLPNYKEFYEGRWFAPAANARSATIRLGGVNIPFGINQLFQVESIEGLTIGAEICEDLWVPIPPSSWQAVQGASVIANLSASNELIGKHLYRKQLVVNQSGRCMSGYVYASCGVHESTTDVVFGGHCLIAENGSLLAESARFSRESTLTIADLDLDRLRADRLRTNSFGDAQLYVPNRPRFEVRSIEVQRGEPPARLRREIEAHPFVPSGEAQLRERCEDIFHTQVAGLSQRLEHLGPQFPISIGISGGLDSTLSLLVACKTADSLPFDRKRILAFTMPGFGTTSRTLKNALALMERLGVTSRQVDIRPLCLEQFRALGHSPFGISIGEITIEELSSKLVELPPEKRHDLVFENVQARMRTSILMNAGFVVGTGDVSESALGWCTYNGDHMSMYNPNCSIPKTLVKFLVGWAAENQFEGETRRILLDIVATEISPELLPKGKDDAAVQSTEGAIGPYELHDFFLYYFLRYGASPEKILFLADQAAFDRSYTRSDTRKWLEVFMRRFFTSQFKRTCVPDGPKVGSISLSPRGDWRMPSDAQGSIWLKWLDN